MISPTTPDPIDAKRLFLPWVVEERNYTIDSVDILGNDGLLVLEDILADFATPIVTAVNNFNIIANALRDAQKRLRGAGMLGNDSDVVNAALAKLEN